MATFIGRYTHVYPMETVSSKVPGEMIEQIDERAEDMGASRSVAVREMLRDSLDERSVPVYIVVSWIGSLLLAAHLTPATGSMAVYTAVLGVLLFLGGLSWPYLRPRLPL